MLRQKIKVRYEECGKIMGVVFEPFTFPPIVSTISIPFKYQPLQDILENIRY